jgi:hypothetical protein
MVTYFPEDNNWPPALMNLFPLIPPKLKKACAFFVQIPAWKCIFLCIFSLISDSYFHMSEKKKPTGSPMGPCLILVPEAGVEPARCCHRGILSPVRLPIPPPGHDNIFAKPSLSNPDGFCKPMAAHCPWLTNYPALWPELDAD